MFLKRWYNNPERVFSRYETTSRPAEKYDQFSLELARQFEGEYIKLLFDGYIQYTQKGSEVFKSLTNPNNTNFNLIDENGSRVSYLQKGIILDHNNPSSDNNCIGMRIGVKSLTNGEDIFLLPTDYLQAFNGRYSYFFEKVWTLNHEITHGVVHFLTAERAPTYDESFSQLYNYISSVRSLSNNGIGLANLATHFREFYINQPQGDVSPVEDLTELTALYIFNPEYLGEYLNRLYPTLNYFDLVQNMSQKKWVETIYLAISNGVEWVIKGCPARN